LAVKPEGKIPHGRHRRSWEDNIKVDLQNVRSEALIRSIWLRMGEVAVTCEYTDEHSGSIKSREFLERLRIG
jgi:carbonic anhydrase